VARPLALLLLGLWLGLLIASWAAATASFRVTDRVLGPEARPELAARLAGVPAADRRLVLRHLAAEINRWMFRWWVPLQLALAGAVLAAAWGAGAAPRFLVGAILGLLAIQALALGPAILSLGRQLDFVERPLPGDVAHRFGGLHGAFVVADGLKAALLAALAAVLIRRAP
jgi:hypothetical protein